MKKELLFDLKAWLLVLLLLPIGVQVESNSERFFISLGFWLLLIVGFYPHQWLIKRFAQQKKWVIYGLGVSLLLCALAFLSRYLLHFADNGPEMTFLGLIRNMAIFLLFSTAISFAYKGIWLQIQYEKTRRQQVEAELKLLQSQVNPHFLFNTLNNIYAQNLSDQDAANDMILQLADLMRYQTESSRKNTVLLSEEVRFLNNYISLEKKRLTANTEVVFQAETPQEPPYWIPPMLFVPFVENAFKHGIGNEPKNFIHINLAVHGEQLIFDLKNSVPQRKHIVQSTQTGLSNVKKRLELLFPNRYQLSANNDGQTYHARLEIFNPTT